MIMFLWWGGKRNIDGFPQSNASKIIFPLTILPAVF